MMVVFVITSETINVSQSLIENYGNLIFMSNLSTNDKLLYLLREVCLKLKYCSTLKQCYFIMYHLVILFNNNHTSYRIIYVI